MITFFCFTEERGLEKFDRYDPEAHPLRNHELHWLDLEAPSEEEIELLKAGHPFHPLAIEDCLEPTHHPKVEEFDDHLFIIIHAVDFSVAKERFGTTELDIFLGERFLVTFHRKSVRSITTMRERYQKMEWVLRRGTDYLLHEVLDLLVDYYMPALERFEEQIDAVETEIFADPTPETLSKAFQLKREVLHLKRIVLPQRELLNRLARGEFEIVVENQRIYFRDVYDHLYRIAESADFYRDMVTGLLDGYLSQVSNKLNVVMKTLTIFATILLPLTFIAGVYGMNFAHMPELEWRYGYFVVLAGMATIAGGMLYLFRRKGWM